MLRRDQDINQSLRSMRVSPLLHVRLCLHQPSTPFLETCLPSQQKPKRRLHRSRRSMNQLSRLLLPSKEPLNYRKVRVVIREAAIGAEAVIEPQRADIAGAGADIVTEAEI